MKLVFGNLRAAGLLLVAVIACGAVARAQQAAPAAREELTAAQALARYEQALQAATNPHQKFYLLTKIAPTALDAGQTEKAKTYARTLLDRAPSMEKDWNYGNALHTGNTVLGLIALSAGDTAEAGRLLLASADHRGSPQLNSFGPEMLLAKELMEKGEHATVAQYLELCGRFWKGHFGRLDEWKMSVAKGVTPGFHQSLNKLMPMWRFENWERLKS